VIPVELGGDAVVRELRDAGYDVRYRRFRGGHKVLPPIVRAAVVSRWFGSHSFPLGGTT
jgi:predicted esterase